MINILRDCTEKENNDRTGINTFQHLRRYTFMYKYIRVLAFHL
jgi:hypothetical protein